MIVGQRRRAIVPEFPFVGFSGGRPRRNPRPGAVGGDAREAAFQRYRGRCRDLETKEDVAVAIGRNRRVDFDDGVEVRSVREVIGQPVKRELPRGSIRRIRRIAKINRAARARKIEPPFWRQGQAAARNPDGRRD